jgi:hypothetical protein
MSSRLRFATAQQVFDAFPKVTAEIALRSVDEAPLDFAGKLLAAGRRFDPIVYIACLLPRREAVWWGCQCVRALCGNAANNDALLAAEAWVRQPEETQRRAALEIGTTGDPNLPPTWLAWAAGHSGGSITPEDSFPVHASPDATALNVKAGVILALVDRPPAETAAWMKACVEAGVRFADGGDAKVVAPPSAPSKSGAV